MDLGESFGGFQVEDGGLGAGQSDPHILFEQSRVH